MSDMMQNGAPSGMPPDPAQNGDQGVQSSPPDFTALVDSAGNAAIAAANIGATSEDQDTILKCAQAYFFYAQGIEKLMPPKPDPAASIKAQADVLKAGSQQAHDAHQAELQREHDVTNLAVQAPPATSQADQGNNNG